MLKWDYSCRVVDLIMHRANEHAKAENEAPAAAAQNEAPPTPAAAAEKI